MIDIAKITVLVYTILVIAGGIMGYVKAKSKPSLISGVVSGLLLLVGYGIAANGDTRTGLMIADAVSILLTVVFFIRFGKTRKFMPSGLMIILSILAASVITMALTNG